LGDQAANHLADGDTLIVGNLLQGLSLVTCHLNGCSSILSHNHLPVFMATNKATTQW
jgi:hypothetical protein